MAGYNPREAIPFWQRMSQAGGTNKPPEFLATHPADENRIARLQGYMNEALKYYKPVKYSNFRYNLLKLCLKVEFFYFYVKNIA